MDISAISKGVYFSELHLENIKCFKHKEKLSFLDEDNHWVKWTIILGDNGLGKTTILQALASFEIITNKKDKARAFAFNPEYFSFKKSEKDSILKANLIYDKRNNRPIQEPKEGDDFDVFIRHYNLGSMYNGNLYLRSNQEGNFRIFSYGANRIMSNSGLADTLLDKNSETLFKDDGKLINAEDWLMQLDYAASKDSNIKDFATKKREQVNQTLKDLLPDVEDIRFTIPTKQNLKSSIEFKTSFGWIGLHQLSLGYRTMISWMVDLAARMFESYPDSKNPLTEPAIVLIDEIDLHLHPKWQRKIFDYLSDKFPLVQFIVTAHSPLVVQSAPKNVNLVLLRKEHDHVVIDQNIENVRQWRIDQILTSDLFGIESSRDPETTKWLEERRKLLQKKELNSSEKERLDYLNKKANTLPTADSASDIEAMEIIRKAADHLKAQKK